MSLHIKLRSPEISESYAEWEKKATAFDREYYHYNQPDKYEVLWEGQLPSYAVWYIGDTAFLDLLKEPGVYKPKSMSRLIIDILPITPSDYGTLIDFLCSYLAACLKFPNAIIETSY